VNIERHEVAGLTLDVERTYDSMDRLTCLEYPDGEDVKTFYDDQASWSGSGSTLATAAGGRRRIHT
jgi:hypothetical protein